MPDDFVNDPLLGPAGVGPRAPRINRIESGAFTDPRGRVKLSPMEHTRAQVTAAQYDLFVSLSGGLGPLSLGESPALPGIRLSDISMRRDTLPHWQHLLSGTSYLQRSARFVLVDLEFEGLPGSAQHVRGALAALQVLEEQQEADT